MWGIVVSVATLIVVIVHACRQSGFENYLFYKIRRLETRMSDHQARLDAVAARLLKVHGEVVSARDALMAAVADLKAQVDAGAPAEELDFSAVDAAAAALDDLNPDPVEELIVEEAAAEDAPVEE